MTTTQIAVTIVVVIMAFGLVIMYVRSHTLEQIRGDVYQVFLQVEHKYLKSGSGKKKLDEAVDAAYSMLPPWARFIFTKERLRKIIDAWFGKVKDLLDDGKMNQSVSGDYNP